ncbi:MAG: efflux transporter outer membrane subunit [Pseudomonadota bacterium]
MLRYLYLISFLSLAACVAVGPRYAAPDPSERQEAFVYADRPIYTANESGDEAEPIAWWEAYSDPRIAKAVMIARERNLDLRQAAARLEGARARAGAARASLLPQGGTSFAITRQEQAQAAFAGFAGAGGGDPAAPPPAIENPEFTLYQAAAQSSWEIDLFGRLRRQAQGASARADSAEQLLADTQRLITGQVVDTFILLVEALNRRRVAIENLAVQEESLRLTEQLFALGEAGEIDTLRARSQVKSTAAQVLAVETAAADSTAAFALLLGMTVPELLVTFPDLLDENVAPPMPTALGVIALREPADVLRRRPDVVAAERTLAAEIYDIGVETAGLFPQVSLDGTASLVALDFAGLSDDNAFGYSFGPNISWQILSYPALLRQRAAAKAEASAALAAFEQTVLTALTETDRALALHSGAVAQAALLTDAQRAADRARALAELRYREGADSLFALVDAQRVALETEDAAVQAQAAALRTRAAIHRVLAD